MDIADAIELLLAEIEDVVDPPDRPPPTDFLPVSTGLAALDKVCDGGLWPGTVTILNATLEAQAHAMLCTSARLMDAPRLLAIPSIIDAARWIVASAAGVPAELIRNATLCDQDWRAIVRHIGQLAEQRLDLTDAGSWSGIEHVLCKDSYPSVLLVHAPERLGPIDDGLEHLAALAAATGLAVLTTAQARPGLTEWDRDNVRSVAVTPHSLGSRAALVTTGGWTGWTAAQIEIEPLTGCVSESR